MSGAIARARALLDALESSDVARAEAAVGAQRIVTLREQHRWTIEEFLEKDWNPAIDALVGTPRRVAEVGRVAQSGVPEEKWPVRFTLEGPNGQAFFTVRSFHEDGLGSFAIEGEICNGIGGIYIHCPQERRQEVAAFYAQVLQRPVTPRGHSVATGRIPGLKVGGSQPGELMPDWPNPDRPQQMHLDVFVPSVEDASDRALHAGATLLQDMGDYRTYADPVGHPFCVYRGDVVDPVIGRVVIDCFSPRALAAFYAELLKMPNRVEDTPERVVIAGADGLLPMLGFQHSASVPPRWGDPRFPQQLHFDMRFEDGPAARALAERLGAVRLAPLGGTCPVYGDPGGHPFCLCVDE